MLAAKADKFGAIVKIKGNVQIKPSSERKYIPAYKGMILSSGDWIKTNDNEFAAIILLDATMLKIHENSDIELVSNRLSANELSTKMYLKRGELWTKVKKQKYGDFQIETPTSVASVKGTEFDMEMDEINRSTTLIVMDGTVEFQNELGSILAGAMTTSKATAGTPPTPPKKISKTKVPIWQKTIEPFWGFNLKPEKTGRQPTNTPLKVTIQVLNSKDKTIARDFKYDVTVSSERDWMLVSSDGSNWAGSVTIKAQNGRGTVQVKAQKEGNPSIVVSADDAEPQKLILNFYRTKSQKRAMHNKLEALIEKKGFSEIKQKMGNRTLKSSTVASGLIDNIDQILQLIDTGEYKIVEIIPVENPDGTITLKFRVKPRKKGSGG